MSETTLTTRLNTAPPTSPEALAASRLAIHALSAHARRCLWRCFAEHDWLPPPGVTCSEAELLARAGVVPLYRRLFAAMLEILCRTGGLQGGAGGYRLPSSGGTGVPEPAALAAESARLRVASPDHEGFLECFERACQNYAALLAGRERAVRVLFPDLDFAMMRRIYTGSAPMDMGHELLARLAVAVAEDCAAAGRRARILEVGAGTGSTTAVVFARLGDLLAEVDYTFTDLSPVFLAMAEQGLGAGVGGFTTRLFNLERPAGEQGFAAGGYDLVLGANVVHTTRSLTGSLERLRALLVPGGRLALFELTAVEDIYTLSFGLLEGWWLAEDAAVRIPHSPLATAPAWRGLLAGAGFAAVDLLGDPSVQRPEELTHTVIIGTRGER